MYDQRFARLARLLASDLDFDLFPPESLVLADLAGRLKRLIGSVPTPTLLAALPAIGRLCDRAIFLHGRFIKPGRLIRRHFGLNVPADLLGESEFETLRARKALLNGRLQAIVPDSEVEQLETTPDNDFLAVHTRNLAIDYDDFVEQFDIARSMTYLNGYLGGSAIPLAADERGRVVRQFERHGVPFAAAVSVLVWQRLDRCDQGRGVRTGRRSPDDLLAYAGQREPEARTDDGVLSVRRRAGSSLRVEIAVLQRFSVPPALRFMEAKAFDAARLSLRADTYRTFFRNTIANFEAVFEGRDPLVGCRPHLPEGNTGVECLEQVVERRGVADPHSGHLQPIRSEGRITSHREPTRRPQVSGKRR